MISDKEFADEMNRLSDRFPGMNNKQTLRRINLYIQGLPLEALISIVNGFLDNFKAQPLPSDFEKAASDWRRQYFLKTGIYFGESLKEPEPVIDCALCQDLGIVKAKEDKLLLFRCSCEKGLREITQIPRYEGDIKKAYEAENCPIEWFKPKSYVEGEPLEMDSLWKRVNEWKAYLKLSENKWQSLGYEYLTSKDRYGYKV